VNLPEPLTGHYSLARPRRVPIVPLLYCTALLDGSLALRLVFGISAAHARRRAVRIAQRNGHPVAALR
jgi:hypothetical protein